MGRTQFSLVLFCLGLFFFSVVGFRHDWFYSSDGLLVLFAVLLAAGLTLMAVGLSRILTGKWWHGLLALAVVEVFLIGAFGVMGRSQKLVFPERMSDYLIGVYLSGFMNCIQYDRSLSQFDSQLQYTLKPGSGTFENWEFNTTVNVNSLGLRDSEERLQAPEVIFLGDSYTMGWGVVEKDSFVRRFEEKTGKKCLNAGVSSYGTAREYLMLKRLAVDSCRLLVVQYCENDYTENYVFSQYGEQLIPEQELLDKYDRSGRINLLVKRYFPFKYLYWMLRSLSSHRHGNARHLSQDAVQADGQPTGTDHRASLRKVLEAVRGYYKGPIVLFHVDKPIYPAISQQVAQVVEDNKDLNIHWLDMRKARLNENDFFLFDPHLTGNGHEKVADFLSESVANARLLD